MYVSVCLQPLAVQVSKYNPRYAQRLTQGIRDETLMRARNDVRGAFYINETLLVG